MMLRRFFLIVGAAKYESTELPDLPNVSDTIDKLGSLIRRKDMIGADDSNIKILLNPDNKAVITDAVLNATKKAEDLFFFFYVGHGLVGRETNKLYLATRHSTNENADFDGYDFDELRLRLSGPSPSKRVIILDCCFGGLALEGGIGGTLGATVRDLVTSNIDFPPIQARSSYSIASGGPNRPADAGEGQPYTAFSGELIDLLEHGTGSADIKALSMAQLFGHLKQRIAMKPTLPSPVQRERFEGGSIVLARNRIGTSSEQQFDTLYRQIGLSVAESEARLAAISKDIERRLVSIEQRPVPAEHALSNANAASVKHIEEAIKVLQLNNSFIQQNITSLGNDISSVKGKIDDRIETPIGGPSLSIYESFFKFVRALIVSGILIAATILVSLIMYSTRDYDVFRAFLSFRLVLAIAMMTIVTLWFTNYFIKHLEPSVYNSAVWRMIPKALFYGPLVVSSALSLVAMFAIERVPYVALSRIINGRDLLPPLSPEVAGDIQASLCVGNTYDLNDTETSKAIASYFDGRGFGTARRRDDQTLSLLEQAVREVPNCHKAGFKNAFEVGFLGVPASDASGKISDLQTKIGALLGTWLVTGKMDPPTRKGIEEARGKFGLESGNTLSRDFIEKLTP